MEDRLLKLLDTEQISSSKFADVIGVQRSSVSHILSGRNKPSFDFLQKTLKAFPLLNADWLMLGEGDMYQDMRNYVAGTLFDQPLAQSKAAADPDQGLISKSAGITQDEPSNEAVISGSSPESTGETHSGDDVTRGGKKIARVILIYSDNTFLSYEPGS